MSWHVGFIDLPYIAGAVGAQIAVAWWVQRQLVKERRAHARARVAALETEHKLLDCATELGRALRERNHLAEVLRHCTCASSPASSPWQRNAYTGKLPDA